MKRGKQIIASLLAFALIFGAGCAVKGTTTPESRTATTLSEVQLLSEAQVFAPFSDVTSEAWYADEVNWCVENDIMSGTTDPAFSPDADMVRITVADAALSLPHRILV